MNTSDKIVVIVMFILGLINGSILTMIVEKDQLEKHKVYEDQLNMAIAYQRQTIKDLKHE